MSWWRRDPEIDWWAVITTIDDLTRLAAPDTFNFKAEILAEHPRIERELILKLEAWIARKIKDTEMTDTSKIITPDYVIALYQKACPGLLIADEEVQLENYKSVQHGQVGGDLEIDILLPEKYDIEHFKMKLDVLVEHYRKRMTPHFGNFAITRPSVKFSRPMTVDDRPVRRCAVESELWEKVA